MGKETYEAVPLENIKVGSFYKLNTKNLPERRTPQQLKSLKVAKVTEKTVDTVGIEYMTNGGRKLYLMGNLLAKRVLCRISFEEEEEEEEAAAAAAVEEEEDDEEEGEEEEVQEEEEEDDEEEDEEVEEEEEVVVVEEGMAYSNSAVTEEVGDIEGQIYDIFLALQNGFQKFEKIQDRQLFEELRRKMDQCKRLIAEFDREVKELEHTDPDTSKILNEREQSMVEEFNYYVGNFNDYLALQKKQYPSNIIRVDLSGGPAEGFEEDNGWLVSSSMTNQQLMDNGHQMMDETDQAIECSKKLVHDVGTETAPAPEDEDKEEEWRKNSRKRKKCNQVKVVKDNMKNGFTKAQIMNGASHILNIMKKYNARPCNPILRTELDQEAKPYIGNTGLRNTLLSRFIDNMIAPGGEFRFRLESIPGGQMYHYWIQGVNEDDSPEITQLKDEIKWLTSEKNELQELGSKILLTLAPVFCDDDEESFKKLPLKEQFVFAQSKLDDLFKDPPADAIPAAYDSLQT